MSFSEIRLPDTVIADLYKSSLVEIPEKNQNTSKSDISKQSLPSIPLQFPGENRKNTLVLVSYPQVEHLPGKQLDFLSTILKACLLNIADIAIINTFNLKENLDDYINALAPKVILLFGEHRLAIAGNEEIKNFNIANFSGIMVVSSPDLESLNQNNAESKLLKKQLWDCLKKLFNI